MLPYLDFPSLGRRKARDFGSIRCFNSDSFGSHIRVANLRTGCRGDRRSFLCPWAQKEVSIPLIYHHLYLEIQNQTGFTEVFCSYYYTATAANIAVRIDRLRL